ncbi:substrate-binding domain-containing protein, partial [Actinomadura adrarensis]
RRIPEDVAVIGFEDSASAPLADPPLTTVHQSVEEMGRQMARLLIARIQGEQPPAPVILQPHLVVRESA